LASESKDHDRIADLVAAFGSDLNRWPAEERRKIEALTPVERAELFRNDRAFGQLLRDVAVATDAAPPSDDLMARILSAASLEREIEKEALVDLGAAPEAAPEHSPSIRYWRERSFPTDVLAAASLLAASLVLGLFVGTTDVGRTTASGISELAGFSQGMTSVQTSALDDALHFQDDEDIL